MPRWTEFTLNYDYHQIPVFNSHLQEPFNLWTDVHVSQGFSWRPGAVAFSALSDGGTAIIRGTVTLEAQVPQDAIRVIAVPFTVERNLVEIGLFETVPVEIPSGTYELIFAAVPAQGGKPEQYYFLFVRKPQPTAMLLVADSELNPPDVLCMEADPAV